MQDEEPANYLGALLFWAYIVAALCFGGFIVRDLATHHDDTHTSKRVKRQGLRQICRRRQIALKFAALALFSFAVLSYHMLAFLLVSYAAWSREMPSLLDEATWRDISKPRLFTSFIERVWLWSTSSTLFQEFAHDICSTPQRFWWTQQALSYSLAWNIYMCIEGTRYQVPHLWAYFVLGQILPNSFVQNLFSTALFLLPDSNIDVQLVASTRFSQWSLLLTFFASLVGAPMAAGTQFYLASLAATRVLLFAPLFILQPSVRRKNDVGNGVYQSPFFAFKTLGVAIAVLLHLVQTFKAGAPQQYLSTLNDNHAVATLGFDYLLGLFSAVNLWYGRHKVA